VKSKHFANNFFLKALKLSTGQFFVSHFFFFLPCRNPKDDQKEKESRQKIESEREADSPPVVQ